MQNTIEKKQIEIIEKLSRHPLVFGAVFSVSKDNETDFSYAVGNMKTDTAYYIASINKFMISALALRLIRQGKLSFASRIAEFLTVEEMKGLHTYQGVDYSQQIVIEHLLANRSGLPGYLIDKQKTGQVAMKELEKGIDQQWTIQKVIDTLKTMQAHFPPGAPNRAKYIDTNHHLLSLILERMLGRPFHEILQPVLIDLGMTSTIVCGKVQPLFAPIYCKKEKIEIPQFMASTGIDIISTAGDQLKFLKAFFKGYFYPQEKLRELEKWHPIFFPFQYGVGIQKFRLPKLLTLFQPIPKMIGHSGSTGAVAFYIPDQELFITGTINQLAAPRLIFQTMIKLAKA